MTNQNSSMDIEDFKLQAEEYKKKGNEAYKSQDYSKAKEYYTNAIQINTSDASYYANRAACYLAMGEYKLCINDCNKSLNIDSSFTKSLKRKGLSQMFLLQFEDAIDTLSSALKIDPKDSLLREQVFDCKRLKVIYQKMQSNIEQEMYDDALTSINEIIEKIPNNLYLMTQKIMVLAIKGNTEEALSLLKSIINEEEIQKDVFYLQGICHLYNGDSSKAKSIFKKGAARPGDQKCKEMLKKTERIEELKESGNRAIKDKNFDLSIKNYSEALSIDPKNLKYNSIILSNRALAYVNKKELKKALDDINQSIKLNDKYLRAYLRRGDIKMKMGEYESAIFDYNKVKELDPSQNVQPLIKQARLQAKKACKKDYYKILGVNQKATEQEISKAYKKLALKWHPDKNQNNKEEAVKTFKEISEAYQVLKDPQKKQIYDNQQNSNFEEDDEGEAMPAQDFNQNEIFKMFFGGEKSSGDTTFESTNFFNNSNSFKGFSGFTGFKGFPGFGGFQNFGQDIREGRQSYNFGF